MDKWINRRCIGQEHPHSRTYAHSGRFFSNWGSSVIPALIDSDLGSILGKIDPECDRPDVVKKR
jgi:hypothetical protein